MPRAPTVRRALAAAIGAWLLAPTPVVAQTHWLPEVRLDNDAYNFWLHPAYRPDEEYTNGVRLTMTSNSAPWWGRHIARETPDCGRAVLSRACRSTTLTLGQDIYTPKLTRTPYTVPNWELERPYFGWLYVEGKARVAADRWLHTSTAALGVSGPPSLGHAMQSLFHRLNRKYTRPANGWETQVGFEPGVLLGDRFDALALRLGAPGNESLDLTTGAEINLGNVRTNGSLGATARFGVHMDHPWRVFASPTPSAWNAYLIAGGNLDYVVRDMSLDGTFFRTGRRVDRIPGVREYQFGAGVRLHRLRLEYRAITRGQEYESGPGHHTYSTMTALIDPAR